MLLAMIRWRINSPTSVQICFSIQLLAQYSRNVNTMPSRELKCVLFLGSMRSAPPFFGMLPNRTGDRVRMCTDLVFFFFLGGGGAKYFKTYHTL
jgi:hypothetical protein